MLKLNCRESDSCHSKREAQGADAMRGGTKRGRLSPCGKWQVASCLNKINAIAIEIEIEIGIAVGPKRDNLDRRDKRRYIA